MAWQKPKSPKGRRPWPNNAVAVNPQRLLELYNSGLEGAIHNPESREMMLAGVDEPNGEQVAYDNGFAGAGEGKLSLTFLPSYIHWPKCWPCPGQTTGDCVSHAGKNCAIVLIGVEAISGSPDPVTGVIEGFPEVTAEAEAQGVVASEPQYGARGHSGQGADCGTLQQWMMSDGGIFLRKPYPELNLDLTKYNASIGINWGGHGVPSNVEAEGRKHQFRTATDCQTHEVVRDFNAAGYPMWACSGLGWSSQRDENGYSRQQGSWSHSWDIIGYDDRPETKQKYGFPLALYIHDWGRWNSGGRDIRDSATLVPADKKQTWTALGIVNPATGNIMIPEGCMWIDARLLNRCDCTAMSNVNGWPQRQIDNMLI
jgi:hypothetical protein